MTTILARQAQVAAAVEAVEGNEEAVAAADAILVYDVAFNPDVGSFKRTPARSSLSNLPSVRGVKIGTLSMRVELKGSGNVANAPEADPFIRACGFARSVVDTAAIGAVTGGPFEAGEPLTFAPSGATGRAVLDTANGASVIRYVELSGTVASGDVVTGGNSGATATLSAGPTTAQGHEYAPASDSIPSLTIGFFNDGLKHTLVGARGNLAWGAVVGEPGFYTLNFTGVYTGTADVAMLTGTTFDSTIPPVFLGVSFGFMDAATAPCFTTFGGDMGAVVEPRLCARNTNGVISAQYTGRDPSASLDPELDLVANLDFYGILRAGTEGHLSAEWGSTAGNVVGIGAPKAQIDAIAPGDRNGLAIGTLTLNLVTATVDTGDDEVQLVYV